MFKAKKKESAAKRLIRSALLLILLAVIVILGYLWLAPAFEAQNVRKNAHADESGAWMSRIPSIRQSLKQRRRYACTNPEAVKRGFRS